MTVRPTDVPPTTVTNPRREIVGGSGFVATLSLADGASALVCASPSRSGATTPLSRNALRMTPSFSAM